MKLLLKAKNTKTLVSGDIVTRLTLETIDLKQVVTVNFKQRRD